VKHVVLIPIASRLHNPQYYSNVLKSVEGVFTSTGIKVLNVIDSEDGITSDVINVVKDSVPILLFLTGGTSKLARELIVRSGVRRALALAHGHHNSLPSAISVRSRLEFDGIPVRVYACDEINSSKCWDVISRVIRLGKALSSLLNLNVGLISPGVDDEEVNHFEEVLESKVSIVPYTEFEGFLASVTDEEVLKSTEVLGSKVDLLDIDRGMLIKALKIYVAMKKLINSRGYDALAIDCFPYLIKYKVTPCIAIALLNSEGIATACEGDLRALMLMQISKALTGSPGWVSNPSLIRGTKLVLAHCTIALNLVLRGRVLSHFESGYPYGISGVLPTGTYTLVGVDREFSAMAALRAELIESGLMSEHMCRTQATLDTGVDLSEFPNVALANHHVLIRGDFVRDVMEISYMLGMDFIQYDSIIKSIAETN